jgi:putative protein-disulfide isomerase
MDKTLHYLFDPFCGWCYGLSPAMSRVVEGMSGIRLRLHPTGLFSALGSRPMDDDFAAYAWANDQRIEAMTGQRFSAQYRERVLGDRAGRFDSGPATLALTAVALTAPPRELEVLHGFQQARYVDGSDLTSQATLIALLTSWNLEEAASRLSSTDADLIAENRSRTHVAQALLQASNASGVPTLLVESGGTRRVVAHQEAYAKPHALLASLQVG